MKVTSQDFRISVDNGVWLCIKVNEPAPARAFVVDKRDVTYDCEIKPHREKRSLDANAYYWALCGKLAAAVGQSPDEVYLRHIGDIGNYEVLCLQDRALPDFERRWKSRHIGRFVETRASKIPGCTTVLAYYGSSDFDRAQMSRLIDNCIQDCKAVGIETMTPAELSRIKEDWNG